MMKRFAGVLAGLMMLASTAGAGTFDFTRLADFNNGLYVYWDTFTTLVSEITSSINNIATDQIGTLQVTGAKIADTTITVGKLVSKTLTNVVISDSADIEFQKLENLTAGNILVGSAANVPTQVTINGPGVTIGWSYSTINIDAVGSPQIATDAIFNIDVNGSAAISPSKLANTTTAGQVLLGKTTTNVATYTTLTGDVTVNGEGVTAIGTGCLVNADVSSSAAIASSKISFSDIAGYKTATDAYWTVTTKDNWVLCKVQDKLAINATGQDIIVNIQVTLHATGPVGAICQMALHPHDGGTWSTDNVSCPMAVFVVQNTILGATGVAIIPVRATWDPSTSGHYFWYQFRDSQDITGGACYLSVLSWTAYKPY